LVDLSNVPGKDDLRPSRAGPPTIPFVLSVGITGHRAGALDEAVESA
jgi:hypothetical protein